MSIQLKTTTQLLDALLLGEDAGAWRLLTERYMPVLEGVARRLGLNTADAEDAAQQTMMALVRELRSGRFDRAKGGLRCWAMAVLRNRVHDIHRINARMPRTGVGVGMGLGAESMREPEGEDRLRDYFGAERDRQVVDMALRRLRAESQVGEATIQAFELTSLRGVPVSAAASACGMSRGEVYVARSRVLGRLRREVMDVDAAMDD